MMAIVVIVERYECFQYYYKSQHNLVLPDDNDRVPMPYHDFVNHVNQ